MTSARLSLPNEKKRLFNPHIQMMRHRLWIVAFTVMGAAAYYIIGALLYLSRQKQWLDMAWNTDGMEYMQSQVSNMQDYVRHYYGVCSVAGLVVLVLAILMGLEGFAYLHRMQTMDFYESQPLKRSQRFLRVYWNGFRIFTPIWTLATIGGIAIGALYGGMSAPVLVEILVQYVRLHILFFGVYNLAILAATISKNAVVSGVMTVILLGAEGMIRMLIEQLERNYFVTYYHLGDLVNIKGFRAWFTSPIANHFLGRMEAVECERTSIVNLAETAKFLQADWCYELITVLMGVVYLVLAYAAFQRRSSESVGQGLVFRWMEGVTKLIIAIPLGAIAGLVVDNTYGQSLGKLGALTVFMIILVVVLFCMLVECICNGSIRSFYHRAWQIPIALVCTFAFFLVFRLDVLGYDRYVPREKQIKDVVLFDTNNYQGSYGDSYTYGYRSFFFAYNHAADRDNYIEQSMHLTDVDAGIQLARLGMKQQKEYFHSEGRNDYGYSAVIMFHMKDGSVVARNIMIPRDVDEDLMNRLIGTDEYRSVIYQFETTDAMADANTSDLCVQYNYGYGSLELPKKAQTYHDLMEAYRKDLKSLNFTKLKTKHAIGSLYFYTNGNSQYFNYDYPVYEDFTNTIAFLEENEWYHTSEIPAEIATQVNIYGGVTVDDKYSSADLYYADPEVMEPIIENSYMSVQQDWYMQGDDLYVCVSLNGEVDGEYLDTNTGSYTINYKKLPKDVWEEFKNAQNY